MAKFMQVYCYVGLTEDIIDFEMNNLCQPYVNILDDIIYWPMYLKACFQFLNHIFVVTFDDNFAKTWSSMNPIL